MKPIEANAEGFVVDAELLAEAFTLRASDIQNLMRSGEITSRSETGAGADAGQNRLTFHYRDKAVRFVVDPTGAILTQSRFPITKRPPKAD